MRVLNRRQLNRIPMVDQGNVNLDRVPMGAMNNREMIASNANRAAHTARVAQARAQQSAAREDRARLLQSQMHGAMLERSLRQPGHGVAAAARKQGMGWVPQFGVKNPTLGFVGEVKAGSITTPDYSEQEVYAAQEFNNVLTARNNPQFAKFQDYPMVMDAPNGDFGGVLTNESGSADFSEYIVMDDSKDFGHTPRMPMRRR